MSIREINYEQDIQSIKKIGLNSSIEEQEWNGVDKEIKNPKNKTCVKTVSNSIVAFIVIRRKDVVSTDNFFAENGGLHLLPENVVSLQFDVFKPSFPKVLTLLESAC